MCGIAGIISDIGAEQAHAKLTQMLAVLKHRGPDDEGRWLSSDGRCLLGQQRLSIIDPEGGHQPMANEDGSVWITFNGCIYNYEDIARILRQKGHKFASHCDTEVIIHAYEEWGTDCVQRFNGMWAFAIWDEKKKMLFCSRDRIGVKPFYYFWDGTNFLFASEIKALLASKMVKAEINPDGLRQYLTFQYCLKETTLFQNIPKLQPGHSLILKQGQEPEIFKFWDINFDLDLEHDEEYFIDHLESLLQDAVKIRLRADVPLGTHLSGGLDSSSVLCLARMLLGDANIKTFTGAFREGAGFDETGYAKLVAKSANAEYLEIFLGSQDFADSIEKIIWHMDEPAAGPGVFPQYFVSKLASHNVKVVLGGQGGDEIFIGYARYLVAYLEECLKGAIDDTASRGEYVATLGTIIPSLSHLEGYKPMLKSFWQEGLFDEPAKRYYRLMDRFSDSKALLHSDFEVNTDQTFEEFKSIFEAHGSAKINRIFNFDLKTHMQALLHVEDRTSMAWSLESRVPLLDYRLVELMTSIPPTIKFHQGLLKYLFRKAVKNLVPHEILNRKDKMGFPVPLNQWFKKDLNAFVSDILLSHRCRQRGLFDEKALEKAIQSGHSFSRSIWGALCLELWHRQFIDGDGI